MVTVRIVYRSLPAPADVLKGLTIINPERTCILILINSGNSEETQHFALKHEVAHIMLGHLSDERIHDDLSYLDEFPEIEDDANRYAEQMTNEKLAEILRAFNAETVYM